jgi:hypothetical protein
MMNGVYMKRFLTIMLLVGAGAAGCSDSTTRPSAQEDFPNAVGTRWVYAVYDSLAGEADTVDVRVTDQVTIQVWGGTQTATRWHLTSPKRDEYRYAAFNADTVRVWGGSETEPYYIDFIYVFPLRVGDRWGLPVCGGDSISVEASRLQTVPGFGERVAYDLYVAGGCLNDYFIKDQWFAPGIGLVEARFLEFGFGFRNETWNLIAYEPPDRAQ